jgi:hypothetical protein
MDYAREGVSINISLAPFGNLLEKIKKQKLLKRPKWPYFLKKKTKKKNRKQKGGYLTEWEWFGHSQ